MRKGSVPVLSYHLVRTTHSPEQSPKRHGSAPHTRVCPPYVFPRMRLAPVNPAPQRPFSLDCNVPGLFRWVTTTTARFDTVEEWPTDLNCTFTWNTSLVTYDGKLSHTLVPTPPHAQPTLLLLCQIPPSSCPPHGCQTTRDDESL